MPVIDAKLGQRTTFRPPWVRDNGPLPLPTPSAPWTTSKAAEPQQSSSGAQGSKEPQIRKQSTITIIPSRPSFQENGTKSESSGNQEPFIAKEKTVPIKVESRSRQPKDSCISKLESSPIPDTETGNDKKTMDLRLKKAVRAANNIVTERPLTPPPKTITDSLFIPPPPPPPEPQHITFAKKLNTPAPIETTPVTPEKAAKLESLRARPRRRPDWGDMMQEVERGAKLKHVQCNDRSAPILPDSKTKGQFVYESEKDKSRNVLLKQIEHGVKLRKVRTNDRSRPNLDGLRQFRRQMTVELIQKSTSVADVVSAAAAPDELDDIDSLRDCLQCARQMLALEIRNKEFFERENKKLHAKVKLLESDQVKLVSKDQEEPGRQIPQEEHENAIAKLKHELQENFKASEEMEKNYRKVALELDGTRAQLETAWLRNQQLELQLKAVEKESAANAAVPISKQPSSKKLVSVPSANTMVSPTSDEESEVSESESDEEATDDETEKDSEAAYQRRFNREVKMLNAKLCSFRDKVNNSIKERQKLKELIKKQQKALREEKKKYSLLQKEVDKMAKLMRDEVEDEDTNEDDEKHQETETESESSEDSESEDDDSQGDEPPDYVAPEEKKRFLNSRVKKYENRLSSLKKGNYLMKANSDRLQDDLSRQKEMSISLQEDLNSVLEELG